MGWWDEGIFGGDSPLDAVFSLQKLFGMEYDYTGDQGWNLDPIDAWDDGFREAVEGLLREHEADVIKWIETETFDDYKSIKAQVLAAVYMATGGHMPDRVRELAVELAAKDRWAMDEPASRRHEVITKFISAIQGYKPGKPVLVTPNGLFKKMTQAVDAKALIRRLERLVDREVKVYGLSLRVGQIINEISDDDFVTLFDQIAEDLLQHGRIEGVEATPA